MFDNLTMEILYYSVIPVIVIAIITLLVLIVSNKKKKDSYKYNYIIKVSSIIMISLALPLITGYTIWLTIRYINKGVLLSNIVLIIFLVILIITLIVLLFIISYTLYKSFNNKK